MTHRDGQLIIGIMKFIAILHIVIATHNHNLPTFVLGAEACRAVGHKRHMPLMDHIRGGGYMPPLNMPLMKFEKQAFIGSIGVDAKSRLSLLYSYNILRSSIPRPSCLLCPRSRTFLKRGTKYSRALRV